MKLHSLVLTQFRNYGSLSLQFSDQRLQLFIGENGSGKTNLLESISILSLSKSVLGLEEEDVKQWGTDFYRVTGSIEADSGDQKTLEVVSQISPRKQKVAFVNDVRVPVSDFLGQFPVVVFLPQDLHLFSGPPSERRRFLDQILCQVSPLYFQALLDYQKILKQRNSLLKQVAAGYTAEDGLVPWDLKVAEKGSQITLARLELIETFGLTIADELRSLGEKWEEVKVDYQRSGSARTQSELQQELFDQLQACHSKDILLQSTTIGPHREDIDLIIDGHSLSRFASRGQQRIAILSLLFLEASFLELRRGEKPVILLDDIFSELDANHQARVLESFAGHQVFMTGVEVPEGLRDAEVWQVAHGVVEGAHVRIGS
jgi:DNA replication and repair protein RecF